jgi:hypothetical protein
MPKLSITEEVQKRVKTPQLVWEASWEITINDDDNFHKEQVSQLVAAKDFQGAFFKVRTWAKSNVTDTGVLVSITRKVGMVI